MVAPDYIGDGGYWDNVDDADGYASGVLGDDEPGVTIPEILQKHKKALVGSAVLTAMVIGGAVKHLKRQKIEEE